MRLLAEPLAIETLAVVAALDEAALEFEIDWIEPGEPDASIRLPRLNLDSANSIAGAVAIIGWLERTAPNAIYRSADPVARARNDWVARFSLDGIAPSVSAVFAATALARAVGLDESKDTAQTAWAAIDDPVERLENRSPLAILEGAIAKGWARATPLGGAAIMVASTLAPLELCDVSTAAYPEMSALAKSLFARDPLADQLAEMRELIESAND